MTPARPGRGVAGAAVVLALVLLATLPVAPAHAQPPEALPRAEAATRATAFHRRLDRDGDGQVTRAEIAAWATERGVPQAVAARTLAEADTNGDGRIDPAEQVADALRRFDAADMNHDARLTPAERDAAEAQTAAEAPAEDAPLPPPARRR